MPEWRRVAVIGRQNAGKTLLLQSLVTEWTKAGVRVAVLKHDGHAAAQSEDSGARWFDWEKPQSDTVRLAAAGAAVTVVAGGGQSLTRLVRDPAVDDLDLLARRVVDNAATAGSRIDMVAAEGWKSSAWPKIAVLRGSDLEWLASQRLDCVQAVYAVDPLVEVAALGRRVYHDGNVARLARDVLAWPQ